MNMKIPEYLLKMPTYLPNDIEGMIFTYPNKFPLIKEVLIILDLSPICNIY